MLWKHSLIGLSLAVLLSVLVYLSTNSHFTWTIFAIAALASLIGFWQVPFIQARLKGERSYQQAKYLKNQNKRPLKYWLTRLGLFIGLVLIGLIIEAYWWVQHTQQDNLSEDSPTRNLPQNYIFQKFKWNLGIASLPKLIEIPAGEFQMGGKDEIPIHTVKIQSPFLMSQTEITFEQYDYYIWLMRQSGAENKQALYPDDQEWGRANLPVINASWFNAKAYANWLSQQTISQCRLPSEAEWEYAARAGTTTVYPWGDKPSHEYANYGEDECCDGVASGKDKWVNTSPVGSFKANQFGLNDMHGNALEWVEDCYHNNYNKAPDNGISWNKAECDSRVLRGGSWGHSPVSLRSAFRLNLVPLNRSYVIGFRVVCALPFTEN